MAFDKNFTWGVATASYQIEGGAHAADKGLSVWDVGSATKGRVFEGHSGDVGCDHYHRFREDVALMKQLGVKAYRFSLNWARLLPAGEGKVSEDGKRFYTELLTELRAAGIEPWITLFHWDYPYALYLRGGWLSPESPRWFEEYAGVVAELFGEFCDRFILINEPQVFLGEGHYHGGHAPFLKLSAGEVMICAHHVLLACGRAEKRIREVCKRPVKIGTAQAFWPSLPVREEDYACAERDTFACHRDFGSVNYYTDPLILGHYPEEFAAWQRESGFSYPRSDLNVIRSQLDFYGVNTYSGNYVTERDGGAAEVTAGPSVPKTDMRWNVYPDALYYGPKYLYRRYGLPIVYTENGVALTEWKDLNGEINDYSRIDFLKRYLRALHRAAQEVPVEGYFHWTLYDNFEWAEGFSKKFGLVHLDPETAERTPKLSAAWYRRVIETNGEEIWK